MSVETAGLRRNEVPGRGVGDERPKRRSPWVRLALMLGLLVTLTAPLLYAQGAGTRYFECRDGAWGDYGQCDGGFWSRCRVALELDLMGCNAGLIDDLWPF